MHKLPFKLGLIAFGLFPSACKHENANVTSSLAVYKNNNVDALLIQDDFVKAPSECRNALTNLTVSALTDGLLRNGALSGLGTDNPIGKRMMKDSIYFQGLRIFSVFDYEWGEGLANTKITPCLPPSVGIHLGSFTKSYISTLSEAFPDDRKKIKEAADIVKSGMDDFRIASIAAREDLKAWPTESRMPAAFKASLQKGLRDKILSNQAYSLQNDDLKQKMMAMASSYTPLYVSFNASLERQTSQTYVEAYLPPLYELKNANLEEVETWELLPGMKRTALPRPVDISVAKLTHIGYLQSPDPKSMPVIKVQTFKDARDPNRLHTRTFFGTWNDKGQEKGAINIDYRDYRHALYIEFYPYSAPKDDDSALIKKIKIQLNEVTSQYRVDARIHRLAIDFVRDPVTAESGADDLRFHPKFSMKNSDISFRLHPPLSEDADTKVLEKLGFICELTASGAPDCYRDFGVYSELREFFLKGDDLEPQTKNLAAKIGARFRESVNQIIAHNVKFIIDRNMVTIEEAIDAQFEQIFSDLLDKQDEMRKKIQTRLENQIFQK